MLLSSAYKTTVGTNKHTQNPWMICVCTKYVGNVSIDMISIVIFAKRQMISPHRWSFQQVFLRAFSPNSYHLHTNSLSLSKSRSRSTCLVATNEHVVISHLMQSMRSQFCVDLLSHVCFLVYIPKFPFHAVFIVKLVSPNWLSSASLVKQYLGWKSLCTKYLHVNRRLFEKQIVEVINVCSRLSIGITSDSGVKRSHNTEDNYLFPSLYHTEKKEYI